MRKLFAFIGAVVGGLLSVFTNNKLDGCSIFVGLCLGAFAGHIVYELIFE